MVPHADVLADETEGETRDDEELPLEEAPTEPLPKPDINVDRGGEGDGG